MQDVHSERARSTRVKYSLVASMCTVAALALAASPGAALAGAFLSLSGIQGESTNEQHKNEIDILSYDTSVALPPSTEPNRPSSRLVCPPVTLMKNLDLASLVLAKKLVQGVHIPRGVLALQRAGANPSDYFILTMDEIVVSEFSQVTSADSSRVVEKVVLTARRYGFEYRPQSSTGGQDGVIKIRWDCATGEVI